jgi:hypothetical protein
MPDQDLAERLAVVEKLTALFKLERMVHLVVTSISLIMLLFSAVSLIYKGQRDPVGLTLMFGSSGLITYSANRLLRMWDQALQVLTSDRSIREN